MNTYSDFGSYGKKAIFPRNDNRVIERVAIGMNLFRDAEESGEGRGVLI